MIQVNEMTKEFGSGKEKKKVLDKVSWTVHNGSIVGLFGEKNSGKTSALRVITGIQSISHGRIILDGKDIADDQLEARRTFGYVPDSTDQFQGLKGEEYLNFMADIYGVDMEDRELFLTEYAPRLKTDLYLKDRMSTYSKSMYKKVMLMGAMIYSPRNLILDSLFKELEEGDKTEVKKVLKEYAAKGNAILLAEQKLQSAEGICDQVVYLKGGTVFFDGSLNKLKEKFENVASLEIIELLINDNTSKIIEKEEVVPLIKLWGGK